MNADKIQHLETLLERKLEPEEKERLRRIGHILGLHADDAIWDMLAAMEYQKTYYEVLPEKISAASAEITQGIAAAAEAEAQRAQGRLVESVAELAQKLAVRINWSTLLPMGLCALVCIMLLGRTVSGLISDYECGAAYVPCAMAAKEMPRKFAASEASCTQGLVHSELQ
ncbi:MAG: hypothetical protein LBV80_00810 [Deltaproteobacteria bacterium]|jgi:TRAP-type mannitol/chloroaromatic compound transport system permease large subunit|nr:hypothetical protein [Deltaproteobacteria bacterium]